MQMLRACTVRASDPEKILSPAAGSQLLWPCHLPCPRAKKFGFGGKCRDDDNFWGCEQCGQTLRFVKQKNDDMAQKTPISHLFCDCGGTRVDHLTFRCAFFADHGDKFHAFTSLDLLNKELERQSKKETLTLLLLGKTGNGKSTLINAMHFYAQFVTFPDALRLTKRADFNSDFLAPASYSTEICDENGDCVKIEAKLGDTVRNISESQTQFSEAYLIPPVEGGQPCCFVDTKGGGDTDGKGMDNQNKANTFGFISSGFSALHCVGIVMKFCDNRADESFNYCVNDGILCNLHQNAVPNIVFLITHSSGSKKAIGVVRELLKHIEQENGVKIPLNKSNVFCFNNVAFEALYLNKMKGVEIDEEDMEECSREWTKSAREFKRLLKHLATVKPHLTRETLSVYAARSAIADIIPIIASNGAQTQCNIVKKEIEELNKTIAEDEKKAEIKYDRVETKELDKPRMVCTSKKCTETETVKTLAGDVKVSRMKHCYFGCSPPAAGVDVSEIVTAFTTMGTMLGSVVGAGGGPMGTVIGFQLGNTMGKLAGSLFASASDNERKEETKCKICECPRMMHNESYTEQVVRRNVDVDPALLARIREKHNTLDEKEAIKQQMIVERDLCCKEPAKWFSFLKSSAVKTFDDEMLRCIDQNIRDADEEQQQKRIDELLEFKGLYIKERTLFETASGNAEEFKLPTENVEQIFSGLFALKMTGKDMKDNYEVVKKAKREHQRQFTAEEERRAAKQNLVKAEPTKCQSAEFGASSPAADV